MINVLIGLAGLGLVIFLHELGHLLAAKSVGISVEAFSVGWGKKLWATRYGETEYRISLLPIGGYCKMQGEHALLRAWQTKSSRIDVEPGDFYAATPMQRIFVLLAGPSPISFSLFWCFPRSRLSGIPFKRFLTRSSLPQTTGRKKRPPLAGLETGDRIISLNGNSVENVSGYSDGDRSIRPRGAFGHGGPRRTDDPDDAGTGVRPQFGSGSNRRLPVDRPGHRRGHRKVSGELGGPAPWRPDRGGKRATGGT